MPKLALALNDRAIRNAKPGEKSYSLADGDGLSLIVSPAGKKSWSFRYRIAGKQHAAVLGEYPVMSLAQAHRRTKFPYSVQVVIWPLFLLSGEVQ